MIATCFKMWPEPNYYTCGINGWYHFHWSDQTSPTITVTTCACGNLEQERHTLWLRYDAPPKDPFEELRLSLLPKIPSTIHRDFIKESTIKVKSLVCKPMNLFVRARSSLPKRMIENERNRNRKWKIAK